MYWLLKFFLFRMDPERAHYFTMRSFMALLMIPGLKWLLQTIYKPSHLQGSKTVAGLSFTNPIGLAAGFDKNARFLKAMAVLGFSHIEVGTVTPRPQPGNPKPRLFRLKKSKGLINRMGFNNDGVEEMARRLKKKRPAGLIVGANIGKNKDTPNDSAVNDYLISFRALYSLVDYFTVNVSSPNTPGLRELQGKEPLTRLLNSLQQENASNKPMFLKIAPDLTHEQLNEIVDIVISSKFTGIIATNTTIDRSGLKETKEVVAGIGAGGLSGEPVLEKAVDVVKYIKEKSAGQLVIIGVGGISDGASAKQHLDAGADLIQLYTGLIYEGPAIVKKILKSLRGKFQ
jgi:dihydroorotate dehydrogenase